MEHSFDIELAQKYGVDCAIVIKNFQFWIIKNKANCKNDFDGRTWTYNSVSALSKIFPYYSEKQIRTILKKLIDNEILIEGNYNQSGYDKTKWYAFKEENRFVYLEKSMLQNGNIHLTKWADGIDQMGKPIPDNKPNKKTNTYNTKVLLYYNKENFVEKVLEYESELGEELQPFIDYWTEENSKGKMRVNNEKFFDLKRRIGTWMANAQKFKKNNNFNNQPTIGKWEQSMTNLDRASNRIKQQIKDGTFVNPFDTKNW